MKDQSQQIERLMTKDNEKSQRIERLMTKDNETSQQIERLMTKDNEKSQQIERLMTKDKEKSQQIERLMAKVNDQSQRIERFASTVQDPSEQIKIQTTVTNTHAPFAWKIPNIRAILDRSRQVRVKNEDIVSEPIYLFENGYKLRIILKPSGSHFVLCVRVVPGGFDHFLSWPFKEKVRVTLIDQNPCKDKRKDISHVFDFSKRLSKCPRPPHERDDKFDYGTLFITHDKLGTGSYIMNDAIFIMAKQE